MLKTNWPSKYPKDPNPGVRAQKLWVWGPRYCEKLHGRSYFLGILTFLLSFSKIFQGVLFPLPQPYPNPTPTLPQYWPSTWVEFLLHFATLMRRYVIGISISLIDLIKLQTCWECLFFLQHIHFLKRQICNVKNIHIFILSGFNSFCLLNFLIYCLFIFELRCWFKL